MSNLLINEPPLQVLPTLANAIGLNEAIILQQIHFLSPYGKSKAGQKWVVKTIQEWGDIFPFWSIPTIRRALANLRTSGLVEATGEHNKANYDKTLWYRVNYDALGALESISNEKAYDQNDHSLGSDQNDHRAYDQNDHSLGSDQNDHTNTYRKNNNEEEEEGNSNTAWGNHCQPLTRKSGRQYPAEEKTTDPAAILVAKMQALIEQPHGLLKKYKEAAGVLVLGDDDRETITAWIDHYQAKVAAGMSQDMASRLAYVAIRDANPAPKPVEPVTHNSINNAQAGLAVAWENFLQ